MRRPIIICSFLLVSPASFAESVKLSGDDIISALSDRTLQGSRDDGKPWSQIFQKSGVTYYSVDGAQSQGVWQVRGDHYCSQWPPNQSWTCYEMMRDDKTYSFISASGKRSMGTLQN
jgi:hypothetical protein